MSFYNTGEGTKRRGTNCPGRNVVLPILFDFGLRREVSKDRLLNEYGQKLKLTNSLIFLWHLLVQK